MGQIPKGWTSVGHLWGSDEQKSHGWPKHCGHFMGNPSTRSCGHLTNLYAHFSCEIATDLHIQTYPPIPKSHVQLSIFWSKLLTRRRSSKKCHSLRWPIHWAQSWLTSDILVITSWKNIVPWLGLQIKLWHVVHVKWQMKRSPVSPFICHYACLTFY